MDASNLLKPALASGSGSAVHRLDHLQGIQGAPSSATGRWSSRFQKIDVAEPSVEETVLILAWVSSRATRTHHGVALRPTPRCSRRRAFCPSTSTSGTLPDKAIDVLDEAGASERLLLDAAAPSIPSGHGRDVEAVVARIADPSPSRCRPTTRPSWPSLDGELKDVIFGQEEKAVDAAGLGHQALALGAGLARRSPSGRFLFHGAHRGMGKTGAGQADWPGPWAWSSYAST